MSFYSDLIIYRYCVFRRHNARQADFKTSLKRLENVPLGLTSVHIYMSTWHPCLQQPRGDTKDGIVKPLKSLAMVVLPRWELKINSDTQNHSQAVYIPFAFISNSLVRLSETALHRAVCRVLLLLLYAKEMDGELNQLLIKDELLISLLLLNYCIRMEIKNLDRGFKIIVSGCVSTTVKISLP